MMRNCRNFGFERWDFKGNKYYDYLVNGMDFYNQN